MNNFDAVMTKRLQPVLDAVAACKVRPLLIAVDGPCGSGKTTLGKQLSRLLQAPCIHMDDFHVPHAMKTAERLAKPGGNSDRERLMAEVLLPWKESCSVSYRPYDCALDQYAPVVSYPDAPVLILEGSYSHHPELAAMTDVQVFVRTSSEEQLVRLEHRCPEKLPMFIARWIPLENAYFSAFSLPSERAIVIENGSVQEI